MVDVDGVLIYYGVAGPHPLKLRKKNHFTPLLRVIHFKTMYSLVFLSLWIYSPRGAGLGCLAELTFGDAGQGRLV